MAMTRIDRKYLLSEEVLQEVLAAERERWTAEVVAGLATQRYETEYFDTPDLRLFHAGRGRHPLRSKVRVRRYVDTGDCYLEVKSRTARGVNTKVREPWDGSLAHAMPFLRSSLGSPEWLLDLVPTARTEYERAAVALTGGGRITIDRRLAVGRHDALTHQLFEKGSELVLVETKSPDHSPTEIDRCLWDLGHRPRPLSKYALAIASFRPDLPLNRWSRDALRLHPLA